jgi:putative oxidoreductase
MNKTISHALFGGMGAATRTGDVGLLLLRAGSGLMLSIGHGLSKLYADGRIGPAKGFIDGVESLGFPAPALFAWCAALSEFAGGLLLALGLLTRPAAFTIAFTMAVAAFLRHRDDPFTTKEKALLYLAIAFLFMLIGAGRFSVDRVIRKY